MTDGPIDDVRFSDDEVREILKRAVESASTSGSLTRSEGMSLAELKSIGGEVGIDPARVEAAALAVKQRGSNAPNRLLGAPVVIDLARQVPGVLRSADTPEVLQIIRRAMHERGEIEEIGGSLEWQSKGELAGRYVTVTSKDGATSVHASTNLGSGALSVFLPLGFMSAIGSLVAFVGATDIGGAAMALALTIFPIVMTLARLVYGRIAEKEELRLQRTVDEVALWIQEHGTGDDD